MIIDIPTSDDFQAVGLALLNTAWDTATSLLIDMDIAVSYGVDKQEIEDDYWASAKIAIATALSTAQQGCEFLIKSRIAGVSPYLLLGALPRDWPGGCSKQDTSFSEFRTIDAQDLIKVHDACCAPKFPDSFVTQFETLRKIRNTIMHSIDKKLVVHVSELLQAVLSIHFQFFPAANWARVRHRHLKNAPSSQMHSEDWADHQLVAEFDAVVNALKPSVLKEYFGFNKKQRRYICPNCSYSLAGEYGDTAYSALLKPNQPGSTNVWCFVCGEDQEVERVDCTEDQCKGNVVSHEWGHCLTCGAHVS